MRSLKIIIITALITALGATLTFAGHHDETSEMRVFVSRDGLMHLISDQRAILRNSDVGAAEFIRAANGLSAMFAMIPSVFEKNAMVDGSRAKPEIWQNWDEFVSVANAQSIVAASIAITAETSGLDAAREKVSEINCGSCHTPFRN